MLLLSSIKKAAGALLLTPAAGGGPVGPRCMTDSSSFALHLAPCPVSAAARRTTAIVMASPPCVESWGGAAAGFAVGKAPFGKGNTFRKIPLLIPKSGHENRHSIIIHNQGKRFKGRLREEHCQLKSGLVNS